MTNTILDRTGAPPELWLLCMMYVVYILNHLAHSQLNGQTPIYAAFGTTPDISALLLFFFYQRVLYHQKNTPFPGSKELSGRFVGIAENVGDALTFLILTDDTKEVIARSVVRPAEDSSDPNLRASAAADAPIDGETTKPTVVSSDGQLPIFNPLNIVGLTYLQEREVDGSVHRAKVVEQVTSEDDYDKDEGLDENGEPANDEWRKYRVQFGDGTREEILTYNQILNHLEKQHARDVKRELDGERFWIFKEILDHWKVEGKWMVLTKWEDNSATWEPLNVIGKDDPVTTAEYARRILIDP